MTNLAHEETTGVEDEFDPAGEQCDDCDKDAQADGLLASASAQ